MELVFLRNGFTSVRLTGCLILIPPIATSLDNLSLVHGLDSSTEIYPLICSLASLWFWDQGTD